MEDGGRDPQDPRPRYPSVGDLRAGSHDSCVNPVEVIRDILEIGAFSFVVSTCVTSYIDSVLLEYIICQSECISGGGVLLGDDFIEVTEITNGYQLTFDGYISGTGMNINNKEELSRN